MFRPLECFIGLRYVQARARRGFVSFISLASLLGIGLGVAALIVILSVTVSYTHLTLPTKRIV